MSKLVVFFFKQKTAYEMCGRDWSSDVCSSDLSPHRDVAISYNNLGSVYRSQSDYSSALDYYQKSLNMQLTIYGDPTHPKVAASYNNIRSVYQSPGDYSSALSWYRRGLAALPPGQSPYRTTILRKIQETEQTITLLVTYMVRAPQLLTIQSHSHSYIRNPFTHHESQAGPLGFKVLTQLFLYSIMNSVRITRLKKNSRVQND